MLHDKIINFALILWCGILFIKYERVEADAQSTFNDDILMVKGHSIKSSEIKLTLANRNVSKIYVYLTHTFYADEDLKLNRIKELQIFATTWNITGLVTFDLSGSDGVGHGPANKAAAGSNGNAAMDGGNFFGLANKTINGDFLTVISNGGNGGNGQDGGASDDVYVLLNLENDYDSGDSGWFSNGDLHNYYKKYFDDRGYDTEISDIDDYTSFYAVFKHDKEASFNVRLHPQKCCGKTGMGGLGGYGGRSGNFIFKHIGKSSEATPKFIAEVGSVGKSGKDAIVCENFALDVRIDTELKKVVFIFLPLHHSFSSKFTILNHIKSSNCEPEYIRNNETTDLSDSSSEPNEIDSVSLVIRYKRFLIENMKNASLASDAQETYKSIDENWSLNEKSSLKHLSGEACQLEKNYFELEKSIDVAPLYQRLFERVARMKSRRLERDDRNGVSHLESILQRKLYDLSETTLIANLELFTETAVQSILFRNKYKEGMIADVIDEELQNNLNKLQFGVNGNFMLDKYYEVIDGFRLTYFPFAVDYLEEYRIPHSTTAYSRLEDIVSASTNKLESLKLIIREINSNNGRLVTNKVFSRHANPTDAFFIWKSSDVRDKIRKLFEGEKVTLLANVNKSGNKFNAIKFNTLDLVFRSADENVNDQLKKTLREFAVSLNHSGLSEFRCNSNIYMLTSESVFINSSIEKNRNNVPLSRNVVYDKLRQNPAILSPYTTWEIKLEHINSDLSNFYKLARFGRFDFDMELHGTGTYIQEDAPICEREDLAKFYNEKLT